MVVGVVAAAPVALPVPPGMMTCGGGVVALWFELLFWPIRPIRTPKPIASSKTPTPATSVVPEETRW
jgi:hypothetical protein